MNKLPDNDSLFETALVSANDIYVKKFLENKINFQDISIKINELLKRNEINKLKKKSSNQCF